MHKFKSPPQQETLKRCPRCQHWLDLSAFNKLRRTRDGHDYYCRDCRRAKKQALQRDSANYRIQKGRRTHEWYKRNRDSIRVRANVQAAAQREERRELISSLKDVPCADCGETYPPYVMDFDHVRDVKDGNIGHELYSWPLERLLVEIAKCDVVCSNCHRVRTHAQI